MPSAYMIMFGIIVLVAVLSWIIPGGAYDYVDPNADKLQPIAGTFHEVASNPQGFMQILSAPVNGFIDSVDIILYTLVIGGFLAVVVMPFTYSIATGIMFGMISWVVLKLCTGKAKDISPVMWISVALFAIYIYTLVR